MKSEDPSAYFTKGDTVQMGKSASVPSAEVLGIIEENSELHYKLSWSTGTTNTKPVSEIDQKATNTTPKF